jgi:hypothetical protein
MCTGLSFDVSGQLRKNTDPPLATEAADLSRATVWMAAPGTSVTSIRPSSVEAFIQKNIPSEEGVRVCDSRFLQLNRDGLNELVASLDYSGREFCNTVLIVSKVGSDFQSQSITAWNVQNVSQIIKDLNNDGISELVIPQPISDYNGAKCTATSFRIYRWDGATLASDVSNSFSSFYTDRARELEKDIRSIEENPKLAASTKSDTESCDYLELDKINRSLGIDSSAGLDRAKVWMNSTDPSLRSKAVRELGEINSQEARTYLGVLSRDANLSVAAEARSSLAPPASVR